MSSRPVSPRSFLWYNAGMIQVFALTTRGLEAVSASEMAALPGVQVRQVAYRRITAVCQDAVPLLALRTVDDVFFDLGTWAGLVRQREALSALRRQVAALDLRPALKVCAALRSLPSELSFSLTVNFVGKRNYTGDEIKHVCAAAIAARHGWSYVSDDEAADLNVRVFIEHEFAWIGVRLGTRPLHRRPYKLEHVPGSLKPPVAAALLRLAGVPPGAQVLDPCCGAGTLLIEADLAGARVMGGDLSPEALCAARANGAAAAVPLRLRRWDARRLPLPDSGVDYVISNPPWGRAVAAGTDVNAFYRQICAEAHRVLVPGGRVVLLTSLPQMDFSGLRLETALEISLFGQTPSVLIFSALAG
ncbi:MAG: methyltransferase domain-containing protein [Anaerolineae bacterium]|nr:methyltransferase domain-containing protein [Anaerolineae bacterium]